MPKLPAPAQRPDTGTVVNRHVAGQENLPSPAAPIQSHPVTQMTTPSRTTTQFQDVMAGPPTCVQPNSHGQSQSPKLMASPLQQFQVAQKQLGAVLATN